MSEQDIKNVEGGYILSLMHIKGWLTICRKAKKENKDVFKKNGLS